MPRTINPYKYFPWAENVARKYKNRLPKHVPLEDCLQEARLAVLWAAIHFDKKKKVTFKTYAGHRIVGKIKDWIRQTDQTRRKQKNNLTFIPFSAMYTAHFRVSFDKDFLDNYLYTKENPYTILASEDAFERLVSKITTERCRKMFRLRFKEDRSFAEIGKMLGCCESRCSQMMSDELKVLKNRHGKELEA